MSISSNASVWKTVTRQNTPTVSLDPEEFPPLPSSPRKNPESPVAPPQSQTAKSPVKESQATLERTPEADAPSSASPSATPTPVSTTSSPPLTTSHLKRRGNDAAHAAYPRNEKAGLEISDTRSPKSVVQTESTPERSPGIPPSSNPFALLAEYGGSPLAASQPPSPVPAPPTPWSETELAGTVDDQSAEGERAFHTKKPRIISPKTTNRRKRRVTPYPTVSASNRRTLPHATVSPTPVLESPAPIASPQPIPWLSSEDFWRVNGRLREGDELTSEELDEAVNRFHGRSDLLPTVEQMEERTRLAHQRARAEGRLIFDLPDLTDPYQDMEASRDHSPSPKTPTGPRGRISPHRFTSSPSPLTLSFPISALRTRMHTRNRQNSLPSSSPALPSPSPPPRANVSIINLVSPATSTAYADVHPPLNHQTLPRPLTPRPSSPALQYPPEVPDNDDPMPPSSPPPRLRSPFPEELPPVQHIPIRVKTHDIPYARPGVGWTPPRGCHPSWWLNNLSHEQGHEWRHCAGPTVLVRQAYEGCPTPATEAQRLREIKNIITRALGDIPGIQIGAPYPQNPTTRARQPPYSFLIRGISEDTRIMFENLKMVSSPEGTLFFTPNRPIIDSFLFSLRAITSPTIAELLAHINAKFDMVNLTDKIISVLPSHPIFSTWNPQIAAEHIRNSLRVQIVTGGVTIDNRIEDVAHVFMDPPTADRSQWREFQDTATSPIFRAPLIGMYMEVLRTWLCDFCHSQLHPLTHCPFMTEEGWFTPPNAPRHIAPKAKTHDEPPPSLPPADCFSTVPAQATTGNKQSNRNKSSGSNNRQRKGKGKGKGRN
ncbi:hypothetical protein BDW22DRAFT_1429458 [Trametopsis cervina]|nr:hypothetical protein BDW22DRAFT_1429458 [Trametopsis cervina]